LDPVRRDCFSAGKLESHPVLLHVVPRERALRNAGRRLRRWKAAARRVGRLAPGRLLRFVQLDNADP